MIHSEQMKTSLIQKSTKTPFLRLFIAGKGSWPSPGSKNCCRTLTRMSSQKGSQWKKSSPRSLPWSQSENPYKLSYHACSLFNVASLLLSRRSGTKISSAQPTHTTALTHGIVLSHSDLKFCWKLALSNGWTSARKLASWTKTNRGANSETCM